MTKFGIYMVWGGINCPVGVWLALFCQRYCKEQFHLPLTGSFHLWPMYKTGGLNGSNIWLGKGWLPHILRGKSKIVLLYIKAPKCISVDSKLIFTHDDTPYRSVNVNHFQSCHPSLQSVQSCCSLKSPVRQCMKIWSKNFKQVLWRRLQE